MTWSSPVIVLLSWHRLGASRLGLAARVKGRRRVLGLLQKPLEEPNQVGEGGQNPGGMVAEHQHQNGDRQRQKGGACHHVVVGVPGRLWGVGERKVAVGRVGTEAGGGSPTPTAPFELEAVGTPIARHWRQQEEAARAKGSHMDRLLRGIVCYQAHLEVW